QLNTEAAKNVEETVKNIADILGGRDTIYALVNKIDQRRKGDMTPEEVQQFVKCNFEIDESHVFEVSAQAAFCAVRFLDQVDRWQGEDWRHKPETEDLAREVWGSHFWEEHLEDTDLDELKKRATKIWETKSKFKQFCDGVISELVAIAAPKLIQGSLQASDNFLQEMSKEVNIYVKALQGDIKKIETEVNNLGKDTEQIGKVVNLNLIINSKKEQIRKIIVDKVSELNSKIDSKLTKLFQEEFWEQITKGFRESSAGDKGSESDQNVMQRVATLVQLPVRVIESTAKNIASSLRKAKNFLIGGKIEFKTKEEGEQFRQAVFQIASNIFQDDFEKTQEQIDKILEEMVKETNQEIDRKARPILQKAQERLAKSFDLDLSHTAFEKISFGLDEGSSSVILQQQQTEERRTQRRRSWWYWLWLIPYEVEVSYTVITYYLKLEDLKQEIREQIDEEVKKLQSCVLDGYLEGQFRKQVEEYLEKLKEYLTQYQGILQQTLQQRYEKSEQISARIKKGEEFRHGLSQLSEKRKSLLDRVNYVMTK
ncbi:hypothetical protein, partial [Thermosynechococcus sp.]|uniref:hypothetical protein n=1 Tax=Thermosynechococcus sp. TaxID=2814275 RepID=UPI003918FE0E